MLDGEVSESIVVSALRARTNFGKLLRRVENGGQSLVIEKRGAPKAVLLSIRDYVRLAAPEPEVLRVLGEESKRKGTDTLTSRQIDQVIKATRAQQRKGRGAPNRPNSGTNRAARSLPAAGFARVSQKRKGRGARHQSKSGTNRAALRFARVSQKPKR